MTIAEHKGHNWYNKGHPDGTSSADGYGVICCKDCNERLYYGRLPQPKSQLGGEVTPDEAVRNLPNGWDNRTIDDIWSLRPPHIEKLAQVDIQEATAANMPKMTDLTVVEDITPDTKIVRDHPSANGTKDSSSPMDAESLSIVQTGSNYSLTAHFSRTIKPTAEFGSITVGYDVSETFPGEIDAERLREIASDQFAILKAMVLTQLNLPFNMNDEGIIHETFPGSQTVGRMPAMLNEHNPPSGPVDALEDGFPVDVPVPARPRSASRSTGRTGGRQQASTGARGRTGGTSRRYAPTTILSQEELWYELVNDPGSWYWQKPDEKKNPRAADYISTKYYKDDGWPVSLWETAPNGDGNLPDDSDWQRAYEDIPEDAFAQQMPRKRD